MSSVRSSRSKAKKKNASSVWTASADTLLQTLLEHADTPPLLTQGIRAIPWQVRNVTPLSRLITSPGFAPPSLAALLALPTTVTINSSDPAATLPIESILSQAIDSTPSTIQIDATGFVWATASVARTPTDAPIVAAFAAVRVEDNKVDIARIALIGVWTEPVRLAGSAAELVGQRLDNDMIASIASAVAKECSPVGDYLGSEEYRRAMAKVTTARALAGCDRKTTSNPKESS